MGVGLPPRKKETLPMRLALLVAASALALAACATVPSNLPMPHYADAASRGAIGALMAGHPSQAQVDEATSRWSDLSGTNVSVSGLHHNNN